MKKRGGFRKIRGIGCRVLAFMLCMILVLNLCGCWSRRELNTLAIVMGTALDVGSTPDTFELTAQIVKAGELKSGTSSTSSSSAVKAYSNVGNTGKSVLSILRSITHVSSRRLYFPHNQILIFSSELAELDIMEGLDAFLRDFEARLNVYILISKGKASDILDAACELEKIPSIHISEMIENQKSNSEIAIVTLRDFAIAMLSGSKAPVAPIIKQYEEGGNKKSKLEGTAVFNKKGKMVGELDNTQTRGFMWITGNARSGVTTVDTKWGWVVLEIMHSKSRLRPVKMEDGSIRMKLEINTDGIIESNETYKDMSGMDKVNMLKKLEREVIRSDVENSLKQAKLLSADVFGFGEAIRRQYPEDWKKMEKNWDHFFQEIGLDVQVEVELRSTGGLTKPVVPGGAA